MKGKLTLRFLQHLHLKETWVIFFILGIIMMNYPFIHMFYTQRILLNMPVLFLYLYLGWLVSIIVIFLFVKAIDLPQDKNSTGEHR